MQQCRHATEQKVENPHGDLDTVKLNRDAREEVPQGGVEGLSDDLGKVELEPTRVTQVSMRRELHEVKQHNRVRSNSKGLKELMVVLVVDDTQQQLQ